MRLFVDAHVFDETLQGSRTYIKGLYRELIRDSPDINFFLGAHDIENLKAEFGDHNNVKYIRYFIRNKYLRLGIYIPFIILKFKIDISHYQYITPLFRFSKQILTIHDILFLDFPEFFPLGYRFRNNILFRHSAKRADFLLTVSDYSNRRISEHFKINNRNILVIPNGVAEEYFDYDRKLPDVREKYKLDRYILCVSRIEPRKNHAILVRAFSELDLWKDGYKLVLIGSKSLDYTLLDSFLDEMNPTIRSFVVIINGSYGDELISFYRNCSLFVYPSLAEGFGIPPLEAAASKVPVLCSNTTSMSDFSFLRDGLFNPESLSELKGKIMMAIEGRMENDGLNVQFIKEKYSWKKSAALFKDTILKKILSK
jgi:glycosyltransferase involved in cell wall biosynthesis